MPAPARKPPARTVKRRFHERCQDDEKTIWQERRHSAEEDPEEQNPGPALAMLQSEEVWTSRRFAVKKPRMRDIYFKLQVPQDQKVYWVNPTLDKLYSWIQWVIKNDQKAVVILPDWKNHDFYEAVWPMTKRYLFFSAAVDLYEGANPPWGSWAVYMDSSGEKFRLQPQEQEWQDTKSYRRRRRRRLLKQHWE